jgi:hypothetical protein
MLEPAVRINRHDRRQGVPNAEPRPCWVHVRALRDKILSFD